MIDLFNQLAAQKIQLANQALAAGDLTALAPMQDVTDLAFMTLMARYGGPDVYWTEYLRVHAVSTPEKWIVQSITQNVTGRPIVAQMIGNGSIKRSCTIIYSTGIRHLGKVVWPWGIYPYTTTRIQPTAIMKWTMMRR